MPFNPIRYRFAILLLLAAVALVTNPVLHAFSHDHFHHDDHDAAHDADVQWTAEELCPYCDAVSSVVEAPAPKTSVAPALLQGQVEATSILYPDLRLRFSTRLRAPPV